MSGPMNGKTGEVVRYLIGLGIAGLVAFYTARIQTNDRIADANSKISAVNGRVDVAVEREQARFDEMQRSLERIERAIERIEATGADAKTGEPYRVQGQYQRQR